jgi:hypothetical protein
MEKGIILFFLVVLTFTTTSHADNTKILNTRNGHTYQLIETKKTWMEAKSHCKNMGGYLVTITSGEEEAFIFDQILGHSNKDVWAGATDKDVEGDWQWITNENFEYTNWHKNEPNNENDIEDYLELKSVFGFKWNDVPNAVKKNWFICEWDKQVNDAVVEKKWDPAIPENPGEKNSVVSSQAYAYYLPFFTYSKHYLTGIGISNSSASQEANVVITVFDNNGHIILTDTMLIVPDGQETKVLYTENTQHGWSRIISDQPLTGVCFLIAAGKESDNFMADIAFSPKTYTHLHVPHVSSDNSWDTHLFIANPNDIEETVYIDVIASDGTRTASFNNSIVAKGSIDFGLSSLLQGKTLVGGKIKIVASEGIVAFALYTNIKTGARSFAGISAMEPFSIPDK